MGFVKEELIRDLLLETNLGNNLYKLRNLTRNMVLIIDMAKLYTGTLSIEGYSNLRIVLNSEYLRIPYEIKEKNVKVYGKVVRFFESMDSSLRNIPNIPTIDSEFLLASASLGTDSLYISKDTWHKLREYGILPEKAYLTIYITDVEINGNKIKVYSQRNVTI